MKIMKLMDLPSLLILKTKLKMKGIPYGRKLKGKSVVLTTIGNIRIGHNVKLNSFSGGEPYKTGLQAHCKDSEITIGDNCLLNGTRIHCRTKVTIEEHCMFGPGSRIVDNDSHRTSIDIAERRLPPESAPILIRKNVWVGMNSLILKGVEIGENSVVAANSVVTKNVPKNTLVGGNPAKIIKTL
ncbi:acyltransferase [Motilimonas pumila]|uniref:Acyltransferase n=1 Tax=Motilimonas pumila TaxID=2303987 RepID=A0A418YAL0_9GAMM|nr:acyltransferase [Motilimonas pumila]RJG39538.1 acyltransferase [Motilimonas pumila]